MSFDTQDFNNLNVVSPLVGDALLFPNALREPGVLSVHKGHFGQGSTVIPFTAALVAGPSLTTPLTWNFLGFGVETGVRNILGTDIKIGSDISLGAYKGTYNALFNKITGKEAAVTPSKTDVAPSENLLSPAGNLLGNWTIMGLPFATVIAHIAHSDARLKRNIEPIPNSTSLTKVLQLNPVSYNWRKDIVPSSFFKAHGEGKQIGLIAQEVEEVIPELVRGEKLQDKKWKGIKYEKLIPLLIGAIKEQQTQIEELQERISVLESKINKE
jgi:hypothetical protein